MTTAAPLIDGFGRVHTDLRISVTDRCNLRCTYCMPLEVVFKPREELLTFEEIGRVAGVAATLGIRTIRLTGGEPLMRRDLPELVRQLTAVPGIEEVALTTNGLLLAEQAADLHAAGLTRLNVSLDSLTTEGFERVARRPGLDRALAGLDVAKREGFQSIRINAVSIKGLTEAEIVPLARDREAVEAQLSSARREISGLEASAKEAEAADTRIPDRASSAPTAG